MTIQRKKSPEELRSYRWLGKSDLRSFGHRSRLKQLGYDRPDLGRQAGDRHHQQEARRIHLHVGEEELSRRRAAWAPPPKYPRGYGAMYSQHIGQADEGCDFDFLRGTEPIPEPEIH